MDKKYISLFFFFLILDLFLIGESDAVKIIGARPAVTTEVEAPIEKNVPIQEPKPETKTQPVQKESKNGTLLIFIAAAGAVCVWFIFKPSKKDKKLNNL